MKAFFYSVIVYLVVSLPAIPAMAQEMIDEDFLENLQKNAKMVWDEGDADFNRNDVPSKWKDESGVIIGYKENVLFDKQRRGLLGGKADLLLLEKKRMKVKLQDKSSVSDFSQLYFRYSDKIDGFGAFVYKPDGSKKEVALNKAVSIEDNDNVPDFFKSFFDRNISRRNEYYKVPVNDLAPGDILEFVAITSSKFSVKGLAYYQFDPQYELCNKPIPTMLHKVVIETDNNSFITAKSLNGAPEFQQAPNGDFTMYTWTDRDRDRVKDVNFINEYMVLPMVKYQIIYTNGNEYKSLFAGSKGQIKTEFDAKEIGEKAYSRYASTGNTYVYGAGSVTVDGVYSYIWGKMKKMDARDLSDDEYIKLAYYMIRHTQVYNNFYYSDKQFTYLLKSLLDQQKIESDIIVTTPNNLTGLKDLLFEDELAWCLRVKDKYVFKATEHSNLFDVSDRLMGNDAYRVPTNRRETTEAVKISEVAATDNVARFEVTAVMDTGLKDLHILRVISYKGITREKNADEALRFVPYMFEDFKVYNGNDDADDLSAKYQDEYYARRKAIKDEFARLKPDYMKDVAERDYSADIVYKNFEMMTDGRSLKKPELKYKESFTVSDKVRKAGRKLLVNVAGLIGGQLQIKKDERERTFDIDVRYPRTLQWQLNFTVPAGYTLEGADNLNMNVDNETGSFKSEAVVNGQTLTVNITKTYKKKQVSKAKWNEMLAFVDAAYNFSHKMVLLKPVQ